MINEADSTMTVDQDHRETKMTGEHLTLLPSPYGNTSMYILCVASFNAHLTPQRRICRRSSARRWNTRQLAMCTHFILTRGSGYLPACVYWRRLPPVVSSLRLTGRNRERSLKLCCTRTMVFSRQRVTFTEFSRVPKS